MTSFNNRPLFHWLLLESDSQDEGEWCREWTVHNERKRVLVSRMTVEKVEAQPLQKSLTPSSHEIF